MVDLVRVLEREDEMCLVSADLVPIAAVRHRLPVATDWMSLGRSCKVEAGQATSYRG
jgi:hypothetical protein